eukprot:XP_024997154.1 collagen alpha-2(VIII) chain-like [Gallus gallus]
MQCPAGKEEENGVSGGSAGAAFLLSGGEGPSSGSDERGTRPPPPVPRSRLSASRGRGRRAVPALTAGRHPRGCGGAPLPSGRSGLPPTGPRGSASRDGADRRVREGNKNRPLQLAPASKHVCNAGTAPGRAPICCLTRTARSPDRQPWTEREWRDAPNPEPIAGLVQQESTEQDGSPRGRTTKPWN